MSHLIDYHIPEAIRIEVLKAEQSSGGGAGCGGSGGPRVQRFRVNPSMTALPALHSLVVRAFNLNGDFALSYLRRDSYEWCAIGSDRDLEDAYGHSSQPSLQIRLQVDDHTDHKSHSLADWDIITNSDVVRSQCTSIAVSLINQVEKLMTRASDSAKPKPTTDSAAIPLNDNEFRKCLDAEGRVKCGRELRIGVYRRGVEPSLRKVVWKHLLNVYPHGLTAQQRIDFMKLKCETYCQMRNLWQSNQTDPTVEQTLHTVRKDVLRTDRYHHYYSGDSDDDDNENVTALLNVLTTYALNHKDRYCQGMSDLASPLLYAMKDESHAYICFCALMARLCDNFNSNGEVMSRKFAHLSQLLQYYDPEFYAYLCGQECHELLFCYRWMLLELKREFPFDDTLHMLEVLWSSMPAIDVTASLHLFDDNFLYIPNKCAQLRPKFGPNVAINATLNACDSRAKSWSPRPRSIKFMPQLLSCDSKDIDSPEEDESTKRRYTYSLPLIDRQLSVDIENTSQSIETPELPNESPNHTKCQTGIDSSRENASKNLSHVHCNGDYSECMSGGKEQWVCPVGLARSVSCETMDALSDKVRDQLSCDMNSSGGGGGGGVSTGSTKSSSCSSLVLLSKELSLSTSVSLLSPDQLGSNDAFMLFLCLTILLQNRDKIMSNHLDANDIQMYFDGLVRKNDVISVLDFARHLFHNYLSHWHHDYDSHP